MGRRAGKETVLAIIISCLITQTVSAATIQDLYDFYNVKCDVECPAEITDTINAYQRAEKYESMYQYVNSSTYDPIVLQRRVKACEEDLQTVTDKLLSAYDLTQDEIYTLESEYRICQQELKNAKAALSGCAIEYNIPDLGDVPTKKEYEYALHLKDFCNPYQEIGDIENLQFPVQGDALISDYTKSSMTLRTTKNTLVTSLFNGVVLDCDESSVTLFCGSDVFVYEGNLDKIIVDKGDTVNQGDVIGKTSRNVLLKLKLGGSLCDVHQLFSKGD